MSKSQLSISPGGQDMAQFEHEYTGNDFSASLKMLNPSFLEGGMTGIYIGSYLQSVPPVLLLALRLSGSAPPSPRAPSAPFRTALATRPRTGSPPLSAGCHGNA